jgi:hypothetical protein
MSQSPFQAQTIVADALALHPSARWVFAAYHIGGCRGCDRAVDETLAEVAEGYRIPLERLLEDLNRLVAQ